MNIANRIKEIIIEQLRVNEEDVLPNASFTDDLGADSLAVVELIMALRENLVLKFLMKRQRKLSQFDLQLIIWRILWEKMHKLQ